jgi:8-oxo-dGTP pyrophosphatase MutT (NUDIX family)
MFSVRAHAQQQVATYLATFLNEAIWHTSVKSQLEEDPGDVFNRSNMRGHITTSALVIDESQPETKILVIHHNIFDRWLQPGGHQEGDGPLHTSAQREAEEETSIVGIQLHEWHRQQDCPFDIDTHAIDAQPRKQEGAHVHHDFIYLFSADSTVKLKPQLEEVAAARWISLVDFKNLPGARFNRLASKLSAVIR